MKKQKENCFIFLILTSNFKTEKNILDIVILTFTQTPSVPMTKYKMITLPATLITMVAFIGFIRRCVLPQIRCGMDLGKKS